MSLHIVSVRRFTGWLAILLTIVLASSAVAQTPLRVVASNVTSGNYQSYETAGRAILQALQPDVCLMQEFNVGGANDTAAVNTFVANVFGAGFQWYRESGGGIPNGVVSRYPIVASGEFNDTQVSDRDFVWARIDIPGSNDLYVFSLHLLTASSTVRNTEAQQLVNTYIPTLGIPAGAYIAIGGDFNTDTRSESCIGTLGSLVTTSSPYPAGQDADSDTNASRTKPYDWVLANPALHALRTATTYSSFSYTNGLVFDTRDYTQAQLDSAFPPTLVGYSGVTNMQHMAVVRTFLIPDGSTVSDGDQVSVATMPRAPATAYAGTNVPMLSITLTALSHEWDAGSVTVQANGSLPLSQVAARVYLDGNGNGAVDSGEALLGTAAFASASATVSLSPAPRATTGTPARLLLTAAIDAAAAPDATVQFTLTGVSHSATGGADVNPAVTPAASGTVTVIAAPAPSATIPVVINKYYNGTPDAVELLVVQDGLDMRGMILKDFSSSMANDNGGKYTFASTPLWQGLRAGTIIILRNNNSAADVTVGGTDFTLDIGLLNTTYFTGTGTFDIAGVEMVMIKAAGSGTSGVAGSLHALAGGTAGAQYTATAAPKLRAAAGASTGQYVCVDNLSSGAGLNSVLSNFAEANGTATGALTAPTLGLGNNASNTDFITFLRGPAATAPSGVGGGTFTANWDPLVNATSYLLDVATDPAFLSPVPGYGNLDVGSANSATVSGVALGTYYYRVRGVDAEGTVSTYSGTESVVAVPVALSGFTVE